jgi:hypothetical protein
VPCHFILKSHLAPPLPGHALRGGNYNWKEKGDLEI